VSEQTPGKQSSSERGVRRKWIVAVVAASVVITAVVIILVFLLDRHRDSERSAAAEAAAAGTAVTSPYDFSELPTGSGPGEVADSTYVSILLADGGEVTSYGLSSSIPAAQALIKAVEEAKQANAGPSTTASDMTAATAPMLGSTLTFLFPDRSTLTFDLYVEQGLVARGGRAWRVNGDLAALIESAVAAGR
jgi:hypothetical protein